MSVAITVRNLPDEVRDRLAARDAQSFPELSMDEIVQAIDARRP